MKGSPKWKAIFNINNIFSTMESYLKAQVII